MARSYSDFQVGHSWALVTPAVRSRPPALEMVSPMDCLPLYLHLQSGVQRMKPASAAAIKSCTFAKRYVQVPERVLSGM